MLETTLFHLMVQDLNSQIEAYFLHDRSLFRIPHLLFSCVPAYIPYSIYESREVHRMQREQPKYFLCSQSSRACLRN